MVGGRVFLITGASRGVGLGLVRHLLIHYPSDRVIATVRDLAGSSELSFLASQYPSKQQLLVVPLDVNSSTSYQQLDQTLSIEGVDAIDVLIANAGVMSSTSHQENFFSCTAEGLDFAWKTNVLGSMLTLQHLGDRLLRSNCKLSIVMSSFLGSLELTKSTNGYTAYRASKAALNMLALSYSTDQKVKEAGGKILCMHPGWVQTDMGGSTAPLTVEQSAAGMVHVVGQACQLQTAKVESTSGHDAFQAKFAAEDCVFVDFSGKLMPW